MSPVDSPVALITGSATGIGRAIALRLADDGFNIAINDIQEKGSDLSKLKHEIETKGRRCVAVFANVAEENEVIQMFDAVLQEFGKLDVMIANAGIILVKSLLEISPEEWDKVQAVNVRGVFLCYKHAGIRMKERGQGGKIIGACSISGYKPAAQTPAYSVSKWAVRGLTQVAAMELGPSGITVNAYCPGMVRTDMWNTIDSALTEKHGVAKGVAFEHGVKTRTTLGRPQSPDDIASLVSFLAGKGSDQITGQSIIMDGGIVFS